MWKKSLFSLIILTFLIGCAGAAPEMAPAEDVLFYDQEQKAAGAAYDDDGSGSRTSDVSVANVEAAPVERMVIKNAELEIITVDPAQSMDEIGKMAESMGGYIVSSNLYQRTLSNGAKVPQANITVVLKNNFEADFRDEELKSKSNFAEVADEGVK